MFYVELSSLLDDLATLAEPVFVAGDFNIRLDRPDDTNTRRLSELFETYGLTCRVSGPTHDRDGTLDIVATRSDLAAPVVDPVIDVGYSDHRLVRWTSDLTKPAPVYTTSTYRPWRRVDVSAFQEALWSASALCSIVNDARDGDFLVDDDQVPPWAPSQGPGPRGDWSPTRNNGGQIVVWPPLFRVKNRQCERHAVNDVNVQSV